jgi:hypothetical protein
VQFGLNTTSSQLPFRKVHSRMMFQGSLSQVISTSFASTQHIQSECSMPSNFFYHAVPYNLLKSLVLVFCSSYSFTTSTLDGGEWSASCPGCAFPPGKGPPLPIGQEAGWAPEPVWTQRLEEKSSASAGDRSWIARFSSL